MPIVIFGGRKGGCGKTTGATNFAAWLAVTGQRVALLDTDPERAAYSFTQLRAQSPELPAVYAEAVTGDVRRTILSLAQEYDWVVVDTPGLDSIETKRAIAVASATVFPSKTSIYDLKTIPLADHLMAEVQAIRPEAAGLVYFSEVAPGAGGASDRAAALAALQGCSTLKLLESTTTARKAYRTCANAGLAVTEGPDRKAADEFAALAQEIVRHAS